MACGRNYTNRSTSLWMLECTSRKCDADANKRVELYAKCIWGFGHSSNIFSELSRESFTWYFDVFSSYAITLDWIERYKEVCMYYLTCVTSSQLMQLLWNWVANFSGSSSQVCFVKFLYVVLFTKFFPFESSLINHNFNPEAIQRSAAIAEVEGLSQIEGTHLERILPQLLLDFWGTARTTLCV